MEMETSTGGLNTHSLSFHAGAYQMSAGLVYLVDHGRGVHLSEVAGSNRIFSYFDGKCV